MRSAYPLITGLMVAVSACAPPTQDDAAPRMASDAPTRVILMIGDGAGTSYWSAARFAKGDLAVDEMPVTGFVDTRNAFDRVTDSAAGATAYATGALTYNGAIGVDADSTRLPTVLERAEERGLATGLVATSTITHATPASFAAHVVSRAMQPEIASQMASKEIEVLMGGGRGFFDGTQRPDSQNLIPGLTERFAYADDAAALRAIDPDTVPALLGLFAAGGMPPASDREPTLAEMTATALDVLDRDEDGFFLMVEGSQPDWRGHENAPLDEVTAEMLDFDEAIAVARAYRARHPETLVVVTADHETGGLALEADSTGAMTADYTTDYHTAAMVPIFAEGPGAERFRGISRSDRVGDRILDRIGAAPVSADAARP